PDGKRFLRHVTHYMDTVSFRIRSRQADHVVEHASQIVFRQAQVDWPSEVHQCLHHAVESAYFTTDHIHVSARIRIELTELLPQDLQMHDDRVDRIFYFVRDA